MSQKTEKTHHFQYKYIFSDQDHIYFISNLCYNYTTRKPNFWSWIKIAYIKDKEDYSRSEVPYVILIIWMTVATTWNETQLFHLSVIIFWHNPTAPWCACFILARFLQLSWQKLGSWILAVVLVTLQVLCHCPKNNSPLCKVSTIWWICLKFPDWSTSFCLLYTAWGLLCSSIISDDRCSCLCLLIA